MIMFVPKFEIMDYHHIVLAHRIFVSLFLLHYVVKLGLLLANKSTTLANYAVKTKIVEMILSVLFLGTGIYLVANGPSLHILQKIKIVCVFASIPLAIIGFKKGNKMLAILSILLLVASYGLAEVAKKKMNTVDVAVVSDSTVAAEDKSKVLYSQMCERCHGAAGDALIAGAKNLQESMLSNEDAAAIIKNGKNTMPAFNTLTDDQVTALVNYSQSLKP